VLALFRTNQLYVILLTVVYSALLHVPFIFTGVPLPVEEHGQLSPLFHQIHWSQPALWWGGVFLQSVNALLVSRLFIAYRFRQISTHIAIPFFLLASNLHPALAGLSEIQFALTFILIALNQLTETYKGKNETILVFNTGFCISIATLFYTPAVWFLLAFITGLNTFRGLRIREYMVLLAGFAIPYFWFFTWHYWAGGDWHGWHNSWKQMGTFPYLPDAMWGWIMPALYLLLSLFMLSQFNRFRYKENIRNQKYIDILYLVLFAVIIGAALYHPVPSAHGVLFALPVGFFLGLYFLDMPGTRAELIHFFLLAITISAHISSLM
jgi:hypothetical protein